MEKKWIMPATWLTYFPTSSGIYSCERMRCFVLPVREMKQTESNLQIWSKDWRRLQKFAVNEAPLVNCAVDGGACVTGFSSSTNHRTLIGLHPLLFCFLSIAAFFLHTKKRCDCCDGAEGKRPFSRMPDWIRQMKRSHVPWQLHVVVNYTGFRDYLSLEMAETIRLF